MLFTNHSTLHRWTIGNLKTRSIQSDLTTLDLETSNTADVLEVGLNALQTNLPVPLHERPGRKAENPPEVKRKVIFRDSGDLEVHLYVLNGSWCPRARLGFSREIAELMLPPAGFFSHIPASGIRATVRDVNASTF